jgi:hypothetical protein
MFLCEKIQFRGQSGQQLADSPPQADSPVYHGGQSGLSSQSQNSLSNLLILFQILPIPQNSKFMMNP